jgi:hypothetical protein
MSLNQAITRFEIHLEVYQNPLNESRIRFHPKFSSDEDASVSKNLHTWLVVGVDAASQNVVSGDIL